MNQQRHILPIYSTPTRNNTHLLRTNRIRLPQDANIRKDQQDDVYWKLIMEDFNSRTTSDPRTKNMMSGKWTRMHDDCQRFNAIYKHLTRKIGESDANLVENPKTSFLQRYDNHHELFGPGSAYGANIDIQRRELDYPMGQIQSTLGLSIIKWRRDLALGFNNLAQFSARRNSKVAVRAGINNKMSG
nr:translocase of chloroplast 159, chloroplastic [Tanacetum cinerariifolium]